MSTNRCLIYFILLLQPEYLDALLHLFVSQLVHHTTVLLLHLLQFLVESLNVTQGNFSVIDIFIDFLIIQGTLYDGQRS
jgi:hypothetical protein